ncbi:ABC-F family ATP-binding cassette domain-containing protein [Actinoplanes sp. NPDC051859]|uniref:ABC-F family ATP-binding cassette domain-containing protein n=1 Tax=Actinoplanes sp. NPDC051859 TaxID=3363909 RepID=UPI0037A7EF20
MLKAVSLGAAHDGDVLFADADLLVGAGDRVGVVGPNGAGKTTLLRVLADELRPVAGSVTYAPGVRVGYVPQQVAGADCTVDEFLAAGLGEVAEVTARMRGLARELAAGGDVLAAYGQVQDRWSALEGWTAETRMAEVRQRLDVAHLAGDRPVGAVSGGEQARLLLARALLAEPDVLLLDEPTNHLDADGARWLADWLAGFAGGVVAVSHDRAFLDAVVTRIVELDGIHDVPQDYPGGGYRHFRAEKLRRWRKLLRDFEAQEKDRRRWEADIARTKAQSLRVELTVRSGVEAPHLRKIAKRVARKAKVRERRLRRQMDSVRWMDEPQSRPPLTLAFPDDEADPGEVLIEAAGLTVERAGRVVLAGVDLRVRRGDRILITGRNGSGKTTLVEALRECAGVPVGVLPQTDAGLRTSVSVVDFFRSQVPVYAEDAERLLAGHQFGPEQWGAALRSLSAGELRRLLLAVLVNSPARVLLLDEPTNFLDFAALDVVEEALRAYRGTLVTVTHDRFFAAAVGHTVTWHVADGAVRVS